VREQHDLDGQRGAEAAPCVEAHAGERALSVIALCKVADVPDDGGLRIELEGRDPLAVFRTGGEYFVVDDICTHGNASLCEGEIIGEDIECPFHRGTFDLRTGRPTSAPCTIAIRTYRCELRGEVLYAEIPPEE
jgi:nitrite reductase/ring-hydroxylating ferredoxin subunit